MEEDLDQLCERVVSKISKVSQVPTSKVVSKLEGKVMRGFEMSSNLSESKSGILHNVKKSLKLPSQQLKAQKTSQLVKPIEISSSLKRDIQLIQMRNFLDPKRFI